MALSSATWKSDSVARYSQTVRSGTRTAADFSVDVGFSPAVVKVTNVTDRISGLWTTGLNDVNSTGQILTVAAGTVTYANTGISVTGRTVMVDVSTVNLETDDDVVMVEAWG